MRPESLYFEIAPKVIPADREAVVTIRPRFGLRRFDARADYEVTHFPVEALAGERGSAAREKLTLRPKGDALRIALRFPDEQEHVLLVERADGETRRLIGDFRVYSLRDDLFACRPYKGDLHLHSHHSDGVESPGYVAAACRRIGLDFMALTDHSQYQPSLEAQQAFAGVEMDLRIFPGEEVHPPGNPVHLVNFGGRFSVNELFADEQSYRAAVKAVEEGRLMLAHLEGDPAAADHLRRLRGRTERLLAHCWAEGEG